MQTKIYKQLATTETTPKLVHRTEPLQTQQSTKQVMHSKLVM